MKNKMLTGQSLLFYGFLLLGIGFLSSNHLLADEGHKHGNAGNSAGTMGQMGMHWMVPPEAVLRKNPILRNDASIERGKAVFKNYCISCHGPEGKGDGPAAKPLNPKPANLVMMSGMHPDGDFFWKISNGRDPMPAWKDILNENQIWDAVNYIQSLSKQINKKSGYGHHSSMHHKH